MSLTEEDIEKMIQWRDYNREREEEFRKAKERGEGFIGRKKIYEMYPTNRKVTQK